MTRNEVSHENSPVPLLSIHDLAVSFETEAGIVRAVSGVDLTIYPKQTLAVVGESGCGKTVTALSILNLLPVATAFYERGSIIFEGDDLLRYTEREMRSIRGGQIAMIFQEPMASLNPVFSIGDQIIEAVMLHQQVGRKQARDIAVSALNDVGMTDAAPRLHAYPHEFSGGMRQRVMIAMALACRPKLLIADEPTTALDVTTQAQILDLLLQLRVENDMAIIFITHDLGVIAEIADDVAVMYLRQVVE
ncbi:MAG: ABC transporter ATP-binding protein, partial [Planctomycetes bacterium]|nr:ABC transporter ATP-binding protein [Planctomycetota bacterium]